jgi:hypothetical protein
MIELMLRTAVVQRADPDDITAWAGSYESSPVVFPLNADGPERFRLLTASELQLLSISSMADDSLDVLQVERVINSQIAASEPLDVALFTAMARRLDTHVRPANPSQDPGRRSA